MYKKILIVGSPGSGKSTLARKIAEKTGHELIHLDNEYWSDTWVATPREEFREKVSKLVEKDCWIMDGNYSTTFDCRLPAAAYVIFLGRMILCRKAAEKLGLQFRLNINGQILL